MNNKIAFAEKHREIFVIDFHGLPARIFIRVFHLVLNNESLFTIGKAGRGRARWSFEFSFRGFVNFGFQF